MTFLVILKAFCMFRLRSIVTCFLVRSITRSLTNCIKPMCEASTQAETGSSCTRIIRTWYGPNKSADSSPACYREKAGLPIVGSAASQNIADRTGSTMDKISSAARTSFKGGII